MALVDIQVRGGDYKDFDPEKMLPREPAAVLRGDPSVPSGKAFYVCFGAGDVRRLVSIEDLEIMVERGDFTGEQGPQGVGIQNVEINDESHLIITLTDGSSVDAGYIDDALKAIDEAKLSAQSAEEWAKYSESYAHGGTGTRLGEDEDNAESYAKRAEKAAQQAEAAVGGDFIPNTARGVPGGVATLGDDGKVPDEQLPAGKEIEFGTYDTFGRPGDPAKLYVDESKEPRLIYTWNAEQEDYILTGGAGGDGACSLDIPVKLLAVDWDGVSAPYTQTVSVPQAREGMTPFHFSAEGDDDMEYAYSLITDYSVGLGTITFYAAEKPEVDINLVLKGVPAQELEYEDNTILVPVEAEGFDYNEETERYEQTVLVDGIHAGLGGFWDIVRSGPVLTSEESAIVLNITDVERLDGGVKVCCLQKPTHRFVLVLYGTYKESAEGDTLIANMPGWFNKVESLEKRTAKDIPYDDSQTKLGAEDVQEAVSALSDQYDNIGVVYGGSFDQVDLVQEQYTVIASISLSPGTYLIVGKSQITPAYDGIISLRIASGTIRFNGRSGGGACNVGVINLESTETTRLEMYSSVAGLKAASTTFWAIRIK